MTDVDIGAIIDQLGAAPPPRPKSMHIAALLEKAAPMISALRSFKESRIDSRFDSWQNSVTGLGTSRDKTTHGFVLPDRYLSDMEMSAIYHHDDMGARMVDIIPQEMMREGFAIATGDSGVDAAVREQHRILDTSGNIADGQRWGRGFGGGATLIGADDGRASDLPLIPERCKDIAYLYTMDRRLLWPLTYYVDPGTAKTGQVETYLVTTVGQGGSLAFSQTIVHESRLIIHRGVKTGAYERVQLRGWDQSVYQRAYNILRMFNDGWQATSNLMVDGNQAVYSIGGLQAMIASGGEDMIRERLRVMDMFRSVVRAIVVDADAKEEFSRNAASFEGVPKTLEMFMLRLAAAVEMPVTILMGQSPAGMNATGESDFRWFYDRIRSMQKSIVGPMVENLTALWFKTKAGQQVGKGVKNVEAKFANLWRETPKDKAARELSIAQRDQIYITEQVFSPDEVKLVRGRPDGFDHEVQISEAAAEQLEANVETKLQLSEDERAASLEPDDEVDESEAASAIKLAPTDLATVVTVNEVRASMMLPAYPGPDGKLTLPEFKAKHGTVIAAAANAEAGTDPDAEPEPPAPNPFPPHGLNPGLVPHAPGTPPPAQAEGVEPKPDEERVDGKPRTFTLKRSVDETGVSGTGDVAHGVLWPNGKVSMAWATATSSITQFDNIDDVIKMHGHNGKTTISWDDANDGAEHPL